MKQLSAVREEVSFWQGLRQRVSDLLELAGMEDESLRPELEREIDGLEGEIDHLEFEAMLSGRYDRGNALLAIHAGAGGTDSQDWAEMLQRMYLRWAERRNFQTEILDLTEGEEAGIKSATLEIKGQLAYGFLKKESGTHRLVRLSPFNADNLRQTSFALIEVLPIIEDIAEIEINEGDLEWDTFRSSGPGGQNVQKVSTAVRVKHLPTNIVVTAQSERSQFQNKENALKILKSKVFQLQEQKRLADEKKLKDWQNTASWGTQIRSYVLHPYKLVKDLRTNFETTSTEEVLDGTLEGFIAAEIRL